MKCKNCAHTFTVTGIKKYYSHIAGIKYGDQYTKECTCKTEEFLVLKATVSALVKADNLKVEQTISTRYFSFFMILLILV